MLIHTSTPPYAFLAILHFTHIRPRGSRCDPEIICGGDPCCNRKRFVPASKECVSLAASTAPHSCVKRIISYSKEDSSVVSSSPVLFLFSDTRWIAYRIMKYGGFVACSLRDLRVYFYFFQICQDLSISFVVI
jgi:hypothetical protein